MPSYRFVGAFERVLHGLSHGVNAQVDLADPEADFTEALPGSTVVARPGDEITTTEPYPHAEMVNIATGKPDALQVEDVTGALRVFTASGQAADAAIAVLRTAASGAQQDPPEDPGEQAGTDTTEHTEGA